MHRADALAELGVGPGDDLRTVRRAYHRLLRERHPDLVAGAGTSGNATRETTRLIEAYDLVVALIRSDPAGRIPDEADGSDATGHLDGSPTGAPPNEQATEGSGPVDPPPSGVEAADEDALLVDAPPDLAWAFLVEAAARVGNTAYVDPSLGLLEIMVRFDGGPTCSVVFTLQGRGRYTEIMCSMASIEAAPTPPIAPVVDALVDALQTLG